MERSFDAAVAELVMRGMHVRTNAHILHLTTTSYAQHMALGSFYEALVDNLDALAEAATGIKGAPLTYPALRYNPEGSPIELLNGYRGWIMQMCKDCPRMPSEVRNLVDELLATIDAGLYKLRVLS